MVNVNTQVSSSMELPFGEYLFLCFYQPGAFSGSCWLSPSLSMVHAAAVQLHRSAASQLVHRGNISAICVWLLHTPVIQEVCHRYGGW